MKKASILMPGYNRQCLVAPLDATPPIDKIRSSRKIAVTFEETNLLVLLTKVLHYRHINSAGPKVSKKSSKKVTELFKKCSKQLIHSKK